MADVYIRSEELTGALNGLDTPMAMAVLAALADRGIGELYYAIDDPETGREIEMRPAGAGFPDDPDSYAYDLALMVRVTEVPSG